MSLETAFTGAAFPIPPDMLLAASVGELLAQSADAYATAIWMVLDGAPGDLPTFKLCGTDVPGDVWLPVLHTESGDCESAPDARPR